MENIDIGTIKTKRRFSINWDKINVFKKFWRLKPISKIIVVFFLLGFGAVVYKGYEVVSIFKVHQPLNSDFVLLTPKTEKNSLVDYKIPEPPQVRDQVNPINGNLVTKDQIDEMENRKVIAVTMNNHTSARPQSGLSQADVVMEVLAEGGITRYVALFYENVDVVKIGPIRSVRVYMIEFIQGFDDPVLLHEGQAGYDGAGFETYNVRADARGYFFKNSIKSLQTAGSRYRDLKWASTHGYVHALFTSGELMNGDIAKTSQSRGWEQSSAVKPIPFKFDDPLEEREDFGTVETTFLGLSSASYRSSFTYDKQSNTYLRSLAGEKDIDNNTGQQIAPKNVVIEWHKYQQANDGHARIILDMIGEDEVTILRDGKTINGTWEKKCAECRTHYFDTSGNEIELNRGQIWIMNVVRTSSKKLSTVEFK
ncbi:MAG TPA: DUF3048 domain-containing protein [bacterium]|nr:DUF3048 domain-containing protein [bacterium]